MRSETVEMSQVSRLSSRAKALLAAIAMLCGWPIGVPKLLYAQNIADGQLVSATPTSIPYDPAPVDWDGYQRAYIKDLPRASASEPMLSTYSERKALNFISGAALKWSRQNKCGTCHTNLSYLMARPLLAGAGSDPVEMEVKKLVSAFATEHRGSNVPLSPFYVATVATALAINRALEDAPVSPELRAMFDYLWKVQNLDGSWHYPLAGTVPFLERNRYYVALLVALGIGYLPESNHEGPAARRSIERLRSYLRTNIPANWHERAILLWASVRTPGLLTSAERAGYIDSLLRLQRPDGGWALTTLGQWPRHDGAPNDPNGPSDGYATGLITMAICQSGFGVEAEPVKRSFDWLKTHQRESGRWFTASLYSDRFENYLSNMATSYALMALKSCDKADRK